MSLLDREHASLTAAGRAFEVVAVSGREALSELFRYEITCASEAGAHDPRSLAGSPASLTLFDGMGAERSVSGVIAAAEERVFDRGRAQITFVLRPAAWALSLGRECRVFHDLAVPEIVAQVLAGARCFGRGLGVKARWELSGAHAPHVYCAQYREDDWSFVRRLIEEEGIYAWFDHTSGESTLVFCDDSSRAPDLTGGAAIAFAHESGTGRPIETVLELGQVLRVAPSKFTVGSFNPDKPKLAVKGAAGAGGLEIYEAEGGAPDSPEACARLSQQMAEAAAAGARTARGTATSVRLVPGMVVAIEGHPLARLDGRYLVIEAACSVTQRRRGSTSSPSIEPAATPEERSYLCRFTVVPAALSYRLPRLTPRGKQPGLQLGVVVGPRGAEVHPDASGRVRVQHHWDREGARDDKAGKWMRVAQRGTADSMLLPRMGWNVATFNEEGEIDAPAVLSRLHDAEHPPAYALPANKTRVVFKTATTPGGGSHNEIHFEDRSGSEEMFVNASKDQKILVLNDRQERVSRDATRTIGNDHGFTVAANYVDTIQRDQTSAIGNDEHVTVHGEATKIVTGEEINVIGGRRSVTAGGKHLDQVKERRTLSVGAVQIDTTLGSISSTAKHTSLLVGGAMIRATAGSIAETCGFIGIQTIGAAKMEFVKKDRVLQVKKNHLETVGGTVTLTAGGTYRDHADKVASWKVAGVAEMSAPVVVLEASEKLELVVGGNTVTITPDDITISAQVFDLTQASAVVVNTPRASHN